MGALDYPFINGTNDQKREYFYKRITYYFPELAGTPDLIYGDLELIYLRYVNEGLIPDSTEDLQTHINTLNTEVLNGYIEPTSSWWAGVVEKLESFFAQKDVNVVYFKDYGACDGVSDDSTALLEASNLAVSLGVPIIFPVGGKIGVTEKFTMPDNLIAFMNGSAFTPIVEFADFVLSVGANSVIHDNLSVAIPSGMPGVRGVSIERGSVNINKLEVIAATSAQGPENAGLSSALKIKTVESVNIGSVYLVNYDYPLYITDSTQVNIDRLKIDTYLRGLYIRDSSNIYINSGRIFGKSPNALLSPGHNGVLMGSHSHGVTHNVHLSNIAVSDSGEHGFRIGGSFRVSNVWHTNCSASNVGGSGFKALGGKISDNNYHDNLYYTDCIAEDCGVTDGNCCGFQIQFVQDSVLTNPIVRSRFKPNSADTGVRMNRCIRVTTLNPVISDTKRAGYAVEPQLGDNSEVRLDGGSIKVSLGFGILINYTGITNRRVHVMNNVNVELLGTTSKCLSIVNSGGGTITGPAMISMTSSASSDRILDKVTSGFNYSGYNCNMLASLDALGGFKHGSQWTDGYTGKLWIRREGTWKEPAVI